MDLIPICKRAVGMDVHLNLIEVCAIVEDDNGNGQVHRRCFGGFRRDRREMAEWIAGFAPDTVVMESTGIFWKSPYAYLERLGIRPLVVNAQHVKQVRGRKTERLRAPREELAAALEGELTEAHLFVAGLIRRHIETLEADLVALERELFRRLQPYQAVLDLLVTLPGVDALAAAKLLVEIGEDMSAFGRAERLAKWAGICPGNHESAGKRKSGKTTKGNRYLRALLCEIAWSAARTASQFKSRYQALVIRRGAKRAIIAIAHKLLKIVYVMLARREPYRDSTIDFQALAAKRNAPRWIRQLKKFGLLPQTA